MTTHQFKLRDYQETAVSAAMNFIKYRAGRNGYVKAPGGSGKSVMIAATAERVYDMGKRVVILARNEKLLRQNRAKFQLRYQEHIGIYCAGLGEKTIHKPITIASIQSIGKQVMPYQPDVLLIDEVQNLTNDDSDDTLYWKFIKANGNPQIIGFTATDFRTASGALTWGEKIIDIPLEPLIKKGYIIPPLNKAPLAPDLDKVEIRLGEYVQSQLEEIYEDPDLLAAAIKHILSWSEDRNAVLIFAQSVRHAHLIRQALADNNREAEVVTGDTPIDERDKIFTRFETESLRYLISCNVLVEGFDAPHVDMVVLLRSTISKGLFEQAAYRGTRPHPGKENFLLLDMGGNLMTHGPLGSPLIAQGKKGEAKPATGRVCPECESFIAPANVMDCPDCGYHFPEPEAPKASHNYNADTNTDTTYTRSIYTFDVDRVYYCQHKSKKGNLCMRVEYWCMNGEKVTEYLAMYSDSDFARGKAAKFFADRGVVVLEDMRKHPIEVWLIEAEKLKKPRQITVDFSEDFPRVLSYRWQEDDSGDIPLKDLLEDEIPW